MPKRYYTHYRCGFFLFVSLHLVTFSMKEDKETVGQICISIFDCAPRLCVQALPRHHCMHWFVGKKALAISLRSIYCTSEISSVCSAISTAFLCSSKDMSTDIREHDMSINESALMDRSVSRRCSQG